MSAQDNISIVRSIYESFNSKDFDSAVKQVDSGAVLYNTPANATLKGPDGFKQFMKSWKTAFPDAKVELKNIDGGENFVVSEFRGTGTHKGVLKTPDGDIQATGKRVDVAFCELYRFKNGKITSMTAYYDVATFMKQLGILTELKMHA